MTPAAAELREFFEQLWGETEGFVYVPVKAKSGMFKKHMVPWPAKAMPLVDLILKYAADEDTEVFYSPALFSERKATIGSVAGSNYAWVDIDGNFPEVWPEHIPLPTIEVQSSTANKRHCYWELSEFTDPKKLQDINRALAYALDADMSGWDANQILRPPHRDNRKYSKPIVAKTVKNRFDRIYDLSAFDDLPRPKEAIRASVSLENLPSVESVVDGAKWDKELRELFSESGETMQSPARDRSASLQRLAYEGAENGWTDEQIMAILIDADDRWGKYSHRSDGTRERILVDLINRARSKIGYNSGSDLSALAKSLTGVKEVAPSDDQVLFSVQELAELPGIDEWIVEDLIVPQGIGLITGRPGVGKTQLAFQLAADLASGRGKFLEYSTPSEPLQVLFMSLEMNMFQLGHIAKPVFERYPDLHQGNLAVYAKGEMLPLDEESGQTYFETLIDKMRPSVVFIDSLSHMAHADLTSDNDMKVAFEFLQRARNQYGFSLVIIHHHRKKANDAQSKKRPNDLSDVYGSFYITAAIDFALDLEERGEDAEEGVLTMALLKNRYARVPEPVKLARNDKLAFSTTNVSFMTKEAVGGVDLGIDL